MLVLGVETSCDATAAAVVRDGTEIRSSVAQPATVRLFANGAQAGEPKRVTLEPGLNRVVFDVTPSEAGFLRFRVVVEAARDTFNENDRADSNTIVQEDLH